MKKQSGTLVKIASRGILVGMLTTSTQVFGFNLISYDGVAARWGVGKNIEIEIDTNFHPYVDEDGCDSSGSCVSIYQTVVNSINSWKDVSNADVKLSKITTKSISGTPHYDGVNQIKVYTSGWNDLPFNPPASALAVTISTYKDPNEIIDSDIFFNAENFGWAVINTDEENNVYDIQNVLTHELGHFLGLDHTSENASENEAAYFDATMFYASRPGETFRRSLENQDVLGIQHLYTSIDLPEPTVGEISPSVLDIDSNTETIEIFGNDFYPTASVILVRNNNLGDISARVISVESDRIVAKIPANNLQSGTYEVVVANSYDKFVRLQDGVEVNNPYVYGTYDQDSHASSSGGGCQSDEASGLMLLALPLLGMMIIRRTRLA
ncbi:MAG: matrixin family metalloprotease [Bdellovibrionales bacterium]|nr:matrixin family metalloprotease [Bdellovibrionales bacterium]